MDAQTVANVMPVFFLNRSVPLQEGEFMRSIEVCNAMAQVIGSSKVEGAQRIRNLWRLYIKTEEARVQLLATGINLRSVHLQLLNENPYTQSGRDNKRTERITICGIPLSFDNQCIVEYLENEFNLELTSDMKYQFERTKDGKLTSYKNGNRFCFVKGPLEQPLPRTGELGGFKCRLFHPGQNAHFMCDICNERGHKTGSPKCVQYHKEQNIRIVRGKQDILSNYFPAKVHAYGRDFDSVEHAFQYKQACDQEEYDLAEVILQAEHAGAARKLGMELKDIDQTEQENIMENLIQQKCIQTPEVEDELINTTDAILAHAVSDKYWGTGLSPYVTSVTKSEAWPGRNRMGQILTRIRNKLIEQRKIRLTEKISPVGGNYGKRDHSESPLETMKIKVGSRQ